MANVIVNKEWLEMQPRIMMAAKLEEQVAIGKILRSIDDKIELNRQINDNLTSITFRLSA
jgi:hypothetical protein